jgi:hypothetical protein
MYTIKINSVDVTSQIQLGESQFTTDASAILDSGRLVLINQDINETERGVQVEITISKDSKTLLFYFLVSNDKITEISKSQNYYRHEVGIIEETKWLEKFEGDLYLDGTTNISTAMGYVYDRLLKKSINIDANVKTYLDSVTVNEHFFNSLTAREMLDFILEQVNGQTRLKNGIIYVDFYYSKNNSVSSSIRDTFERETTFNDYATKAKVILKNALNKQLSRYIPSKDGITGLRSKVLKIDTDNNAVFDCGKGIEIIEEVIWQLEKADDPGVYDDFDITSYVVEFDEWVTKLAGTATIEADKKNSLLWFKRGERYIENFFNDDLPGSNPIRRIFELVTNLINHNPVDAYNLIRMRVKFKGYDDLVIENERLDTTYIRRDSQTIINQQAEVLDLEKATKNSYNQLQRIGHDEYMTSEVVTDLNNLKSEYDYDGDYLISSMTYRLKYNHLAMSYIWTKNFTQLQKQIKIDSKKRYYAIPKEFVRVKLFYKDYIELSDTNKTNDASYITTDGISMLFQQYGGIGGTNSINYYDFDNNIMPVNDRIIGSVNPFGTSGGIYIKMGFETNQEQGIKTTDTDDTNLMKSVKYVATNGTLNNFDLKFIETYDSTNLTTYPLVNASTLTGKTYIDISSGIIDKRSGEALDVVYQLIPYSDDDTAYLYEEFFKNNPLIKDNASSLTFKVYESTEKYNELDLTGRQSYAVTDQSDNLLLAINTTSIGKTKYFNFLKDRTDIIKL